MATITEVAELQKTAMALLNQRMAEFEAHLQSASTGADLSALHKDYASFKEHVWGVLSILQQQMAAVSKSVDAIEMRHRRKFLLLGGLTEEADEKVADRVVSVLRCKLGMDSLEASSLITCHRLGTHSEGHPRPILMRFADSNTKTALWKSKAKLKGTSLVLSEFLTRQRQTTFITARKLFGMSNVWTLDGTIYIRLPDNKRQRVFSCDEVVALGSKYDKAMTDPSALTEESKPKSRKPLPLNAAPRPKRAAQKNK